MTNEKMKNSIVDFLYWTLGKLEGQEIKKVSVDLSTSVELSRVIPRNGKWYQIQLLLDCWIKAPRRGTVVSFDQVALYKDGAIKKELVAKYMFDEHK